MKTPRLPAFAVLPFAIFLLALNVLAQQDRAVLTGTTTDASQAVIVNSTVTVDNRATGFHRVATTNESGSYYFGDLPIGVYQVSVSKDNFQTERFESVELVLGQIRTLNAQLQVSANIQEVTVAATPPPIAASSADIGGVLTNPQVANLPLNGRAWTGLMALVPGAIDSGGGTGKTIRFAGRGVDDANYRFDGIDATGISNQAPNASYRLQISMEAIAEFRVDSLLYSAETGGTAGGQVGVISKSGTNGFHGSAFEYLRNDKISARSPFDPATLPPLRLNQFGDNLGGPIVKNRTFFFVAYEGLRQHIGTTLIGNVPSDSFRASALAQSPEIAPLLAGYPRGNRALTADVSQYVATASIGANEDSGFVRVDHRISDSMNLFARFNIDQVLLASPSLTLLDRQVITGAPLNGTLNLSYLLSPQMTNVVEVGVNSPRAVTHTDSHLYDVSKLDYTLQVAGFPKLQVVAAQTKAPTSYSLKDDWSLVRGQHTIKAGAEVKDVHFNYNTAPETDLVYSSLAAFKADQLGEVDLVGGLPMEGLRKTEYFGYVQDQWRIRPNLTATVGLRYEFFNRFHEEYGRDRPFDPSSCGGYCPQGSEFSFPVTNNFEPRAALAWSPQRFHGDTVVRSGFGLYKGEGQLADLNSPTDNFQQRFAVRNTDVPNLRFPPEQFFGQASSQTVTPRGLQRQRQDPTVAEWGVQVQTALPAGLILDTGYTGSHGYHQFSKTYANLINPLTGQRPIAGFGQVDMKQADGNSFFHGWQTSLQRQFRSGWLLALNYMWSHAVNDGSVGGGEADYPENVACRACERASSDFDVRHTFTADAVYTLPFGQGRRYLNHGGAAGLFLGGWQLSGVETFRSGLPVNVTMVRAASAVPDGNSDPNGAAQRPDLVPGVSLVPLGGRTTGTWFNPAAFAAPANGTFGNAGRNLIRGPRLWQADIAVNKSFRLTERFSLDFRSEAFNVFNRAQFGNPSGNYSSASFGQITSAVSSAPTGSGTPRQLQFVLRLNY